MKRGVFWAKTAHDDFLSLIAYIAKQNVAAARRIATALRKTGEELGNHAIGHPGRLKNIYEKSVTGLPYMIAYEIETLPDGEERLYILRIIHAARQWPKEEWPK